MPAWTEIAALDVPTAGAFDFPSLSLGAYRRIRVRFGAITVTTDDQDVGYRLYLGGSEISSGYVWFTDGVTGSSTFIGDTASAATMILLHSNNANFGIGNAAGEHLNGVIDLGSPAVTTFHRHSHYQCGYVLPSVNPCISSGGGYVASAGAITGFKLLGTANLVAGWVRILGCP